MRSKRLEKRSLASSKIRSAIKDGRLVVTLKKKKDEAIDRALRRGDEKTASDVVATTVVIHDAVKLGRALEAAGHEDVERRVVTALADCVTAMKTGEDPFEVEKETSKVKQNQEQYLIVTALRGRRGRGKNGGEVILEADEVVDERKYHKEIKRATAAGERKQRRVCQTEPGHALAHRTHLAHKKKGTKNRRRRAVHARKAAGVATPKDCMLSLTLGAGGGPLFVTQKALVPKGRDNRPLIAAEAAARAVQHRAEKGKKTPAEKAADRRARLPDNVRPSKAKSRAGQYYVAFSIPLLTQAGYQKGTWSMSVVKPGTNGFYASIKAAVEVRDEWIKLKRPESWLAKNKK